MVDGYRLVFDSAPVALSLVLTGTARDDGGPLALMGLVRGDIVDAGVVVLVVIPVKVSSEVGDGGAIAALLQLDRPLLRLLRLRRILRREVAEYINRMLPEIEAAKTGKGTLTREQIAAEWIKLKEYYRLLDLCDSPLKDLDAVLAKSA